MPFDLKTAKPIGGGFDIKSAKPIGGTVSENSSATEGGGDHRLRNLYTLAKAGLDEAMPFRPPLMLNPDPILNAPRSAYNTAKGLGSALMHPVDTAKSVGNLALGTAEKVIPGRQDAEIYPEAVGKMFADRYGGMKNIGRTFQEDPVGMAADVSSVLGGGGAIASKLGEVSKLGTLARAGAEAGAIGAAIDPLALGARTVAGIGGGVRKAAGGILSLPTGTGGAINETFEAAKRGGNSMDAMYSSMRDKVPGNKVADDAVASLQKMRANESDVYGKTLGRLEKNIGPIDLKPIKEGLDEILKPYNIERKVTTKTVRTGKLDSKGLPEVKTITENAHDYTRPRLDDAAVADVQKLVKKVEDWGSQPGDNTVKGLDILKRQIDDFYSPSSEARAIVAELRNKVKTAIVEKVPEYEKMTKRYSEATDLMHDISSELSLKRSSPSGTTLKKLQQTLRKNFEFRKDFVKTLDTVGGKHLIEQIAGSQMKSWTPHGLMAPFAGAGLLGALKAVISNPEQILPTIASIAAAAPFTSPRIVGEGAAAAGRITRRVAPYAEKAVSGLRVPYQAGRLKNKINPDEE